MCVHVCVSLYGLRYPRIKCDLMTFLLLVCYSNKYIWRSHLDPFVKFLCFLTFNRRRSSEFGRRGAVKHQERVHLQQQSQSKQTRYITRVSFIESASATNNCSEHLLWPLARSRDMSVCRFTQKERSRYLYFPWHNQILHFLLLPKKYYTDLYENLFLIVV